MLILNQPPIVYIPEVQQFLDRAAIALAPGTLNSSQRNTYATFITNMVNSNLWARLDALYLFATISEPLAVLNLISADYTCTVHNNPPFEPGCGFTGTEAQTSIDNSTPVPYINTNFNPTAAAPSAKFTRNNGHISAWSFTNRMSTILGGAFMGARDTNVTQIRVWCVDPGPPVNNLTGYSLNDGALYQLTRFSTLGWKGVGRQNSSQLRLLDANGMHDPVNAASTGLINLPLYVLARNTSGTASVGTPNQIMMASIGESFANTNEAYTFMYAIRSILSQLRSGLGLVPATPPMS